ncbi:MAG: class I SAM-dependent methyltransferase [Bacteroidota bacterium]
MPEILSEVDCRYCGSKDCISQYSTTDIFEDTYQLHRCNSCEAHFIFPFPTEDQLARAYADDYYGEQEEKFKSFFEKIVDTFRKRRAKRLSKKIKSGAKVLDIGCGNGKFLMELESYVHCNLYGIEPGNKAAQRVARIPEITLKNGVLEKNDFPENIFDAITLFHVFEHLPKPKQTLECICEILKPEGILVISMPNIISIQSRLFKGKWLHLDPPRHLLFFSMKSLDKIMIEKGFEPIGKTAVSFEQNPFGFIQSFFNLFFKKRELLFESMKGNEKYTGGKKFLIQKLIAMFLFPFLIVSDLVLALFNKSATYERVYRKK